MANLPPDRDQTFVFRNGNWQITNTKDKYKYKLVLAHYCIDYNTVLLFFSFEVTG